MSASGVIASAPVVTPPVIDFAGHSIPAAGGTVRGDHNAYPDRLSKMLGARQRRIIANGGAVACWPSANATGDGGGSWMLNNFTPPAAPGAPYLPCTTMAVVHYGLNDLARIGSLAPTPMVEATRAILSRYCATALFEETDPSWAFTGTWGTAAAGSNWAYSGGGMRYSQTVGDSATWTVPADYPGNQVCAIGMTIIPGTVGAGSQIVLGVTIDGVAQPNITISLDKNGFADAENAKNSSIVLRFGRSDRGRGPQLAAGSHTIKLTTLAGTTAGVYFIIDYAQIEADPNDGPVLVLPSLHRCASATNNGYNLWAGFTHGPAAGVDPMNDAAVATYNTALKAVLNDFPGHSLWVDIDTPLGKTASWFAADGAHPTNQGHSLIAETIANAVQSSGLLTVKRCNRTTPIGGDWEGGLWRPIGGQFGTSVGIPFQNTWAAYGSAVEQPAFYKDLDGRVWVRGTVKQTGAGAANSAVATVAAGYIPAQFHDLPCMVYTGAAFLAGAMRIDAAGNLFFVFNGQVGAGNFGALEGNWRAQT